MTRDPSATRMDPDPAEAADVHLANAIAAAHNANLNLASSEATKALACLGLDSAFTVTVHRADAAPQPEPAASERVRWSGRDLRIDDEGKGYVSVDAFGVWVAKYRWCDAVKLPDEPTARAVLLALAGEKPGATVELRLRDSWTREDVDRARGATFLRACASSLLEAYAEACTVQVCSRDPDVIRAWVKHGQGLMTLRVVDGGADDCPF